MELYQIQAFVAVAEELHVGRAAARLHLAQPTLSRQIAALERDLGVALFSRARRRLELTCAGGAFLDDARELLRRVENARHNAQQAARGKLGNLRLGFVQSAVFAVVPRLVGQFRAACPDVALEVRQMRTVQQIPALLAGDLDVGILRPGQLMERPAGLCTRMISRDYLVAALPTAHPLAARERLPLSDLASEPFVLYAKEAGSTMYQDLLDQCRRAGFTPRVVQESVDPQTIIALVAAGLGVSLLVGPAPPIDPELVTYRELTGQASGWEMALAWSERNRSATLSRFLEIVAA